MNERGRDMKILEVRNASKIYGEGDVVIEALKQVNLEIEAGEFIAILGPSGSGKSTLLNMIGGLDKLTQGEILFRGEKLLLHDDDRMSEYRRDKVGFVFQSFNLIPVLSVYENIVMPLVLSNRRPDNDYINDLMTHLGIEDRKNAFPNQLSGGQQQRVAIARALANKPELILADEPTGNLDTRTGREVLELLTSSGKRFGQTIIMITHNESIAEKADRIVFIENGEVISEM